MQDEEDEDDEEGSRGGVVGTAEQLKCLEIEQARALERVDSLIESQTCKVCLDAPIGGVLVPCGHLALCVGCASRMRVGSACPFCRKPSTSFALTFTA